MPLFDRLLELIGRLLHVPLDLFAAAYVPFFEFNFKDQADYIPAYLIFSCLAALFVLRGLSPRWRVASWLAFGFTLTIACLAPLFLYFDGWYWLYSEHAPVRHLPDAFVRFMMNLLSCGDTRLMYRRWESDYCYAWAGWTIHTCLIFVRLWWTQMTRRQRIMAALLFLAPWVLFELFFKSPFEYLTF